MTNGHTDSHPLPLTPSESPSESPFSTTEWDVVIRNSKKMDNFNALFEERLSTVEQQQVLEAISEHYQLDGMPKLMKRLIGMRFFDLR
jgi:hypothetical protein